MGKDSPGEPAIKKPRRKPPTAHLMPPWQPGQSGNPRGKPLGARSRLTEKMLCDFERYYKERGAELLKMVERENPAMLLQILARLIPKEANINVGGSVGLSLSVEQRRKIAESWLVGESETTLIESEVIERVAQPRLLAPADDEQDAIPNRAPAKPVRQQQRRRDDWDETG